jgi:hypothetical protein
VAGRGRVDGSSAMPTHDSDEDDDVVFGSDDFGSTRVVPIHLSLPLSRSFSVAWCGSGEVTIWRRGMGTR